MRIMSAALIAAVTLGPGCDAGRTRRSADAAASRTRASDAALPSSACTTQAARPYAPDAVTRERDMLLMLLAFAIAYDDWQDADAAPRRGHNIAAVLAGVDGTPVCWARNSVFAEDDATQHAEVRLLTSYLRANPGTHGERLRLYSTLEPCVMCAGMTLMTGLDTVLYGEHAGPSGAVYERLARDTHAEDGLCPYYYSVVAAAAPTEFVARLDAEKARSRDFREWMNGPERRAIHAEAARTLDVYEARQMANVEMLTAVRRFRAQVPRTVPTAPYRVGCPSFEPASEIP